jgi:putative drug exporter of the RND superfamily
VARLVALVVRFWPAVIAFWAVVATGLVLLAPAFDEVATFDDTSFLPEGSRSIEGNRLIEEGWPDDDLSNTLTLVIEREEQALRDEDVAWLRDQVDWLRSDESPDVLGAVTTHFDDPNLEPTFVAADEQAMFALAGIDVPGYTPRANEAVASVREHVHGIERPDGLNVFVTGSVAVAADENVATQTTVERTTGLTLGLVGLILLLVYRSPIAPLVPMVTIGTAFLASRAVISLLAQAGMPVSALYETFAIVIIFGAGTDYCLFLVSRYHEELVTSEAAGLAPSRRLRVGTLSATVLVMLAVLGSSAATTVVGFSAQGAAQFGLYRTMGPALAISIAVTVVITLTLAPALMRLFGRRLFWPDRWGTPKQLPGHADPLVVQYRERLGLEDLAEEITPQDEDATGAGTGTDVTDARDGSYPEDDAEVAAGASGQDRR